MFIQINTLNGLKVMDLYQWKLNGCFFLIHLATVKGTIAQMSLLNYMPFVPTWLHALHASRAYVPSSVKLLRAYVRSFFTCLRAYNHSQKILRLTSILRIAVLLWIIWPFIPFKTPKQAPASKTAYPSPILWGFVISTGACAETILEIKKLRNYLKQWTLSSILNS